MTQVPETASDSAKNSARKTTPRRRCLKIAAATIGLIMAATLAYYLHTRFVTTNFHEVIPGKVYRSAQPSPSQLEQWIAKYQIKTVLNLRSDAVKSGLLDGEMDAAKRAGTNVINIKMKDRELPDSQTLQELVNTLKSSPQPILLHCRSGADRTGFAAVVAEMLIAGKTYDQARPQMSVRYLHVNESENSIAGPLIMYERHCREKNISTGGWTEFSQWLFSDYVPPAKKSASQAS